MESAELGKATGYKINWRMFAGRGDVIKAMASSDVQPGQVGSSPPLAAVVTRDQEIKPDCKVFVTDVYAKKAANKSSDCLSNTPRHHAGFFYGQDMQAPPQARTSQVFRHPPSQLHNLFLYLFFAYLCIGISFTLLENFRTTPRLLNGSYHKKIALFLYVFQSIPIHACKFQNGF